MVHFISKRTGNYYVDCLKCDAFYGGSSSSSRSSSISTITMFWLVMSVRRAYLVLDSVMMLALM